MGRMHGVRSRGSVPAGGKAVYQMYAQRLHGAEERCVDEEGQSSMWWEEQKSGCSGTQCRCECDVHGLTVERFWEKQDLCLRCLDHQ